MNLCDFFASMAEAEIKDAANTTIRRKTTNKPMAIPRAGDLINPVSYSVSFNISTRRKTTDKQTADSHIKKHLFSFKKAIFLNTALSHIHICSIIIIFMQEKVNK